MFGSRQTDDQIAAANIGHFDHTYDAVLKSSSEGIIPGVSSTQHSADLEGKLGPGRQVQAVMKFEQMDIFETTLDRKKRLLTTIVYASIAVLEWDHMSSSVKVQVNGTRDSPMEGFMILKVANSLELENEVKLRLRGLADGGQITLTFSYLGVFAGPTKPKPFQRKRANLSTRDQGKLPPLSTMRDLALARHMGSGTPSSGMSRRLRNGLDHIHHGENSFTVVNAKLKGGGARTGGDQREGVTEMLSVESRLTFTAGLFKYSEGNKTVISVGWDDIFNWEIVDRAHQGDMANGLDLELNDGQKWFFVVLDVLMLHYSLQFFWNCKERLKGNGGAPPRPQSTHGRQVVSTTTLEGVVPATPIPHGDKDVIDDHGVLVRSAGYADTKKAKRKAKMFSLMGNKNADFSVNPVTDAYWDGVVKHQGWLLKKGGLTRAWIKRYAVLYSTSMGHFLCYYSDFAKSPLFHSDERERNIIDLAKTTFVRPVSKDREAPTNSFDICTIEREWTLSADTKASMQTWLQCITRCIDEDVAIVPDDELVFVVKPRVDPSVQLVKNEYSTALKVSASGVSVCHVGGEDELQERFFWCYTDFFKWSILHHQNKTGLQISVFTSSDFSVKDRQEFLFRTRDAVKLATAIEFYIEKFMSAMHLYLEGTDEPARRASNEGDIGQPMSMDTKQMGVDAISPDKQDTEDLLGAWGEDGADDPAPPQITPQHRPMMVQESLLDIFSEPLVQPQQVLEDPFAPRALPPDVSALSLTSSSEPDFFVEQPPPPPVQAAVRQSIDVRASMQETAAFAELVNRNNAGVLYESGEVSVAILEHAYKGSSGRVLIGMRNSSSMPMVEVESAFDGGGSGLECELGPPPASVAPGSTASQQLVLECMRPYDEAPTYTLRFRLGDQPYELQMALPTLFTKFLEPVPLLATVFVQRWATLGGPNLECMRTFGAVAGPATAETARPVLTELFNVAVAQGVDDANGTILSGATALRTSTLNAGGEKISVGCLVRLEMNAGAKAYRLTVRTAVPHVSIALATAIQKLL